MDGNQIILGILFLLAGVATGAFNLIITGAEGIISINSLLSFFIILVSLIIILNGIKPEAEDND